VSDHRDEPENRAVEPGETPAAAELGSAEPPPTDDADEAGPIDTEAAPAGDTPPPSADADTPPAAEPDIPAQVDVDTSAPPVVGAEEAPAEASTGAESGTEPVEQAEGAPPPEPEPAPTAPGEIEWQPVVTGEQIEWQPVMTSEPEAWTDEDAATYGDPSAADYPYYSYEGEYESAADAGWDPAAAPLSGNGAPGTDAPVVPAAAKTKRQVVILSVLTALVVLVGVLGFVLSRGATEKGDQATPGVTTSVPIVTVPQADLVTFRDEQTGFSVKYPKTWRALGAPLSDIRLTLDAGGNDGLRVRIFPIQTPATTENIANLKAVTDTIVFGDPQSGRKHIQEQLVTLNGHLTYYYIYTFPDPVSGQEGVHVTYFVFEGHRMFQLVFQTVPAEEFRQHAGIYDQIAESFTVEPERPGATTSPPTTAAPPTTVR
jgi:hypothetical protein